MGLRSLVEAICVAQNIKGKNLEAKIEGLKKLLPASTAEKIHALRFIGNQAAHEFKKPRPDDLHLGIEICQDILNFLLRIGSSCFKAYAQFQIKV